MSTQTNTRVTENQPSNGAFELGLYSFAEERASDFPDLFEPEATDITRIKPAELAAQLNSAQPPIVLDVRSRAHYDNDEGQIPGSIRVMPDQMADWAASQPQAQLQDRLIVTYCHCPDEASSGRAARLLQGLGLQAVALLGGYAAWEGHYPIEPKASKSQLIQMA